MTTPCLIAVGMQKVIMQPLSNYATTKPIGIIWHEGISGRNAEVVASTFCKILNYSHCLMLNTVFRARTHV